jgi:anti-anti-sigma factor
MTVTVEKAADGSRVTLKMPAQFDFKVHKEFRGAYDDGKAPAKTYFVDLRATDYMDSSALGMLLQLREYVGGDRSRVQIVNVKPGIRQILTIANFDKLMTIS